jgi:hypothetical protein
VLAKSGEGGGGEGAYETDAVASPTVAREVAYADDDGGGGGGSGGSGPPPSDPGKKTDALVIEGWLRLEVDAVAKAADTLRAKVAEVGGRIVTEELNASDNASYGRIGIRLPPEKALEFLDWLEKQGDVVSRRLQATDVSKTLVDYAIRLENLELTLRRLQDLVKRDGINMQEVIALEREMERVRGEIERLKGEQRWLLDRVAYATIEVQLATKQGVVLGGPKAKFHPGPRASMIFLTDPNMRESTRLGAGVSLHIERSFQLDIDFFAAPEGATMDEDDDTWVFITAGGAAYSDFLGRGKRRFLNPYLGLRLGYARMDDSRFVLAGEAGLELFKHKYVMVEAAVRALGTMNGDGAEGVIQTTAAVIFAF